MAKTYGSKLRELRKHAGKTMADLADHLGCSIVYISDIERSRRNPPGSTATRKLLDCLGFEEELPEMLRLAVKDRKSVLISLKRNADPEVAGMLGELARRADDGTIDSELAKQIRKLLEDE